jgi:hypothetical protein
VFIDKFSSEEFENIAKDEHRKFVKFHNLVDHEGESEAFWMRHGVHVAMAQLHSAPLVN